MSNLEQFRTAGHTGVQTLDAKLPKEKFLSIQRVIDKEDNNTTIGYLFRGIPSAVADEEVILSNRPLRNGINQSSEEWRDYERNTATNPRQWILPSGPLFLELCYITNVSNSKNVQDIIKEALHAGVYLRTEIDYRPNQPFITHDHKKYAPVVLPNQVSYTELSSELDVTMNEFLHALFGKRYTQTAQLLKNYGSPVTLWMPRLRHHDTTNLAIRTGLVTPTIIIDTACMQYETALGITAARNILSSSRYEVRDE